MRKFLEYAVHKLVLKNNKTLLFFFPLLSLLILILIAVNIDPDSFNSPIGLKYLIPLLFLVIVICVWLALKMFWTIKEDKRDFTLIKFQTCSPSAFKLHNEKEQRSFYEISLKLIINDDLTYPHYESGKVTYSENQSYLIKELLKADFKNRILAELDFARFKYEIERHVESKWIREIFNYRYAFQTGIQIVLTMLEPKRMTASIDEVKDALLININLNENGVSLDKRGLKDAIHIINKINLEGTIAKERILISKTFRQSDLVKILEVFTINYLPKINARDFITSCTGYSKVFSENHYLPVATDTSNPSVLIKEELKDFIAVLKYLRERNVFINSKSNSDRKLSRILEKYFSELPVLGFESMRTSFSTKSGDELPKEIRVRINTFLDRFPQPKISS
ncbi:hypothetical protein K8352_16660 [Flavobacteriaceae bacterium F89]|uniref:Uncharacterized protein n=1 Tax=Cerina litoralis TaxID=2874477 RepID=A0AAE3EWI6_9FLAO|nr:hypothetical protein [Cerina litoralis]MCG2462395.1 hypothetical protein [Cerina litoralis]